MAAAEEISVDVALAAVLSEFNGISCFKNNIKTALKAFLGVSFLLPTGFGKCSIKHCSA